MQYSWRAAGRLHGTLSAMQGLPCKREELHGCTARVKVQERDFYAYLLMLLLLLPRLSAPSHGTRSVCRRRAAVQAFSTPSSLHGKVHQIARLTE
jgi:hypothetical protein